MNNKKRQQKKRKGGRLVRESTENTLHILRKRLIMCGMFKASFHNTSTFGRISRTSSSVLLEKQMKCRCMCVVEKLERWKQKCQVKETHVLPCCVALVERNLLLISASCLWESYVLLRMPCWWVSFTLSSSKLFILLFFVENFQLFSLKMKKFFFYKLVLLIFCWWKLCFNKFAFILIVIAQYQLKQTQIDNWTFYYVYKYCFSVILRIFFYHFLCASEWKQMFLIDFLWLQLWITLLYHFARLDMRSTFGAQLVYETLLDTSIAKDKTRERKTLE